MDEAAWVDAGLYDPESPTAEGRLALLQHLSERGFTIEQMTAANEDGRLIGLAIEHLIQPTVGGMTVDEASARTGISPDLLERAQRALGLPPIEGPFYDPRPAEAFAAAAAFFGTDEALQFTRVLGSSISRLIDAAVSLFVNEIVSEEVSELDLSQRGEYATGLLLALPDTVAALFPTYVSDAARRLQANFTALDGGLQVAVGFVDLVGSSSLVQRLSGPDLARAVGDFETAAYDLALTHDSRVVKFIGDEAMFVSPDAAAACAVGVSLCEVVDAHPLLDRAHGAVGHGSVVAQNGDYYGPLVTLVSRLTGVAGPDQLVATAALAEAVTAGDAGFEFTSIGAHSLRGFADPVEAFTVSRR